MDERKVEMAPQWISSESWAAFVEMRRRIKAPLTQYAETLILRELVKLKSSGEDPQACLDQSIMLGWRDVFPLRHKGLRTRADDGEFLREFEAHGKRCGPPPADVAARLGIRRVS